MKKYSIFVLWFALLSIPLSYMMGMHSLSLNPSKKETLKSLVNSKASSNKWSQLHFLGGDCGCSENVFKSLMKRKPASDINEQVFIIGKNDQWIKSLKEKGYFVINADMDEFVKKYSINAVPQLSIFDNKNNLLYSGGYTSKRGPASIVEDRLIYQELKEKQETSERPIFGCLNGSINRKNADPLKIKY
jgi:thioredoxin-related protein